jgi:flagellar M-ring protein FliF
MNAIKQRWGQLGKGARAGIVIVLGAIVLAGAGASMLLLQTRYEALFTGLSDEDSASIVAELERLKVPYRIDGDSRAVLVPSDEVARTRMKVMTREVPLQGAVGFEVFNNSDFGMTEFVQKVNYQRALQGELTRTILSLDAVQSARVHLALPEQSLFRKADGPTGKASVTLRLKDGQQLSREQILGIQRLVAASVPEIQADAVTVLDQRGQSLSRAAESGDAGTAGNASLELKRSVEEYLARKVTGVLDRALGAGEAAATVDVTLNLDQIRVTTEEVLAAKSVGADAAPAGVVVRERQNWMEAPAAAWPAASKPAAATGTQSVETEYLPGKRIEQAVLAPGSIKSLNVAVVVRRPMEAAALDKLREVVAAAIGLNRQRGDAIAIQAMPVAVGDGLAAKPMPRATPAPAAHPTRRPSFDWSHGEWSGVDLNDLGIQLGLGCLAALAAVWLVLRITDRRRVERARPQVLSEPQRQLMLTNLREWLDAPAASSGAASGSQP